MRRHRSMIGPLEVRFHNRQIGFPRDLVLGSIDRSTFALHVQKSRPGLGTACQSELPHLGR